MEGVCKYERLGKKSESEEEANAGEAKRGVYWLSEGN